MTVEEMFKKKYGEEVKFLDDLVFTPCESIPEGIPKIEGSVETFISSHNNETIILYDIKDKAYILIRHCPTNKKVRNYVFTIEKEMNDERND